MGRPKNPNNTLHKLCPTCGNEFTCEKRKEKTYCSKKCSANAPEIKEKNRVAVAAAFEEKYGGHPMAVNEETKNRLKETMLAVHGVDHNSKLADFTTNVKRTKLEKYGDENYNNLDAMKKTCVERYGVDNVQKDPVIRAKWTETHRLRYGVDHPSKQADWKEIMSSSTFKQSHKLSMFKKFYTSEKFKYFVPCFDIDDYAGVTVEFNRPYKFKCLRCDLQTDFNLASHANLRCPNCDMDSSIFQTEVIDYIRSILPNQPIVINNRAVISPLELDIYIPSKNLAIETNGIYYHSEVSGTKNSAYHINKTRLCAAKGIRLVHIFETEWTQRGDAIKSVINHLLGIVPAISYSVDECEVREINSSDKSKFLEHHNIYGNDTSMVKLGLFREKEVVSVMTFSKFKFLNNNRWEISRYCATVSVDGGMKKLFDYFSSVYKPDLVTVYADRRYFSGQSFLPLGFSFTENTPPAYYYIIDAYDSLENPVNWQKSKLSRKLKTFDATLSEWENMKINGFDRIWDCGHSKWIWKSQKTS